MNALILTPSHAGTVSVQPTAIQIKESAITESRSVTEVSSEFEQSICVSALQKLQSILKSIEKSRTEVKSPVLELGRKIDSTAKDFGSEVEKEAKRLNGILNAYVAERRRIAEEAERARQAELRRIEDEKRQAEAAARKAEDERRSAAEAEFLATSNAEAEAAAKRQAEAEAAQQAAEEQRSALSVSQLATMQAPAITVARSPGMQVRDVWQFEVTNIGEVYKAHPEFVTLEIRRNIVNRMLAEGLRECPGLRIWKETKTRV